MIDALKIITDPVYSNIIFSKAEGLAFTDIFFNRLHNVKRMDYILQIIETVNLNMKNNI